MALGYAVGKFIETVWFNWKWVLTAAEASSIIADIIRIKTASVNGSFRVLEHRGLSRHVNLLLQPFRCGDEQVTTKRLAIGGKKRASALTGMQ